MALKNHIATGSSLAGLSLALVISCVDEAPVPITPENITKEQCEEALAEGMTGAGGAMHDTGAPDGDMTDHEGDDVVHQDADINKDGKHDEKDIELEERCHELLGHDDQASGGHGGLGGAMH